MNSLPTSTLLDGLPFSAFQARVVALAFVCALFDGIDLQLIAYTAPAIAASLNLPATAIGLMFSVGFVGLVIGSLFLAPLGDRWGRRPVIVMSLLFFGSCVLLTSFANSMEQITILRLLTGLGLGAVMPNAITLSAEYCPTRYRTAVICFTYFGFIIGGSIAGLLSASLLPQYGWERVFFVAGGLSLLVAGLAFFAMPESFQWLAARPGPKHNLLCLLVKVGVNNPGDILLSEANEMAQGTSIRTLFRPEYRRNTAFLWVAMFANLISLFSLLQWLPSLLTQEGIKLGRASTMVSALWGAAVFGSIAFIFLSRKIPPQGALAIFLLSSAMLTSTLGTMKIVDGPLLWVIVIGIGFFGAAAQIGFYSLLSESYPTSIRVTGIGVAQGFGRTGAIFGPAAVGAFIGGGIGNSEIFFFLAGPLLISAGAVLGVRIGMSRGVSE